MPAVLPKSEPLRLSVLKRYAILDTLAEQSYDDITLLAAQNVEIELVLQTRGHAHVAQVLEQLRSAGLEAVML